MQPWLLRSARSGTGCPRIERRACTFRNLGQRLPATATQFECRVVGESPTHLEARYMIDGHIYRLVGSAFG